MAESVLITGSSGGIGEALVEEFARAGWKVFATARNAKQPELSELTRQWENLSVLTLDVAQESTILDAAKRLADGALDVLINNAAIFPGEGQESFETIDPEWFNQAFDTNVVGVARVTKAFLPHLRRSAHARIANISSGAGSISEKEDFNYYPYSVSKAALNMLTRALAAEFRKEEMIVTAISPGWVKTRMGGSDAPLSPRQSAQSLFKHRIIDGAKRQIPWSRWRRICLVIVCQGMVFAFPISLLPSARAATAGLFRKVASAVTSPQLRENFTPSGFRNWVAGLCL